MTGRQESSGKLRVFVTLYATAYLADLTEAWQWPIAGLVFLALTAWVACSRDARRALLVFSGIGAAYTLGFQFPDVGNHDNAILFLNLYFLVAAWRSGRRRETEDELFETLCSPVRVIVILVYFWAGFSKLNRDFFHPEVGCAADFSTNILEAFHLPPFAFTTMTATAAALFVLTWELGGAFALLFRRLQLPMLFLCWIMHTTLAQLIFFDFAALVFALLLTFLPEEQWRQLLERRRVRLGPWAIRRELLYFSGFAVATCLSGLLLQRDPGHDGHHRWQVIAIAAGFLVFVWPVVETSFRRKTRWVGVPVWSKHARCGDAVVPALVVLWALQPYLGLRTAGCFTMFSNLRTEGEESNHLLLGSNPLKVFDYQEDLVEVLELDARHARNSQEKLAGHFVPVVEFKKRIVEWRRRGLEGLHAEFRYQGRHTVTEDVVADNPWNVEGRSLEMYLLDFRKVQSEGPNQCRW